MSHKAQVDLSQWSGEGTFTQVLLDRLQQLDEISLLRVQDAPSTRSEANYNFVSNEIFVAFATRTREEKVWRFGFLPLKRRVDDPMMTLAGLEQALVAIPEIGPPDYSDEGMLPVLEDRTDCAGLPDPRIQAGRTGAAV